MNPDTGRFHEMVKQAEKMFSGVSGSIEERHGCELPPEWPTFVVGQELKQIKGFRLIIQTVDTDFQTIIVKPVKR